jgi:hypothetical protein
MLGGLDHLDLGIAPVDIGEARRLADVETEEGVRRRQLESWLAAAAAGESIALAEPRAKLLRLNPATKAWADLGVNTLRVLASAAGGRLVVSCLIDTRVKVLLSAGFYAGMPMDAQRGAGDKAGGLTLSLMWSDPTKRGEPARLTKFCVRVKTQAQQDAIVEAIGKATPASST